MTSYNDIIFLHSDVMLPHLDIVDNAHIMVANYDEISFQSEAATTENVASPFIFLVFRQAQKISI